MSKTPEQEAQAFTAGDVAEIANLVAAQRARTLVNQKHYRRQGEAQQRIQELEEALREIQAAARAGIEGYREDAARAVEIIEARAREVLGDG